MDEITAQRAFGALAHPTRLAAFRLLVRHEPRGMAAGAIADHIGVPQNTLSTHMAALLDAGLARQERVGRSIIYRAHVQAAFALADFLKNDCCGGNPALCAQDKEAAMADRIFNVLFICTGNTARSVLAEAILAKEGAGRFRAFSGGSQPKGVVNPIALKVLARMGYPASGMRSKSWTEFEGEGAPEMNFTFTVCDNAAGEACPIWPGHPATAHWGIDDPAAVEGTDAQKELAFMEAFRLIKNRIMAFIALPVESLDRQTLQSRLKAIGQMEGASMGKGS